MTFAVTRSSRAGQWIPLVGVGAALGALTVIDGPVLCPFRRCTGGYCPLCGATRSAATLARLDPVGALRLYPALPLLGFAVFLAVRPGWLVGQQRVHRLLSSDRLLLGIAAAISVIWLVRMVVGDVPSPTGLRWPLPIG